MAYNRTTWENREVENPRTYVLETNPNGTVTLVPAEGTIIAAGTPLNADPLNNIEKGILAIEAALSQANANYIRQPGFAQTSGTAAVYNAALNPGPTGYYEGFGITIIPHVINGENATLNINGLGPIPLKDQRGNAYAAGRLLAGKPYTFRKVGTDFLADSAGGYGNAQRQHVLTPYTFTNEEGDFVGMMPHITSTSDPAIGVGQWSNGDLAVYPREGYRKGGAGAGEIRVTTAQLQSADSEFRADVILEGNNIYGVNGGIPNLSARNQHMPGSAVTVWDGDRIFIMPPAGYFNGSSWVTYPVPGLTANNLRAGVNVGGLVGNMREYFGGSLPMNADHIGLESGQEVELLRVPAGFSYLSCAGLVNLTLSLQDWKLVRGLLLAIDAYGNELKLTGGGYLSNNSRAYTTSGLYIDKAKRQITTTFNGSGPERSGGWDGETDIGENGTFTKPFNMDNYVRIVYRVESTVGSGYNSMTFKGKALYN
ncbi:MAG TPA: hypothetical protein VGN87_00865 [Paenibacillus sp.]|jgi:hypothetical protein